MRLGILVVISLAVSLTACKNRFETYEPYSAFDERMAMVDRPAFVPDDQVPPAGESYQVAGESYPVVGDPPYQVREFAPNEPARVARNSQSRSAADDMEVKFDDSRGQEKHPVNIGALD